MADPNEGVCRTCLSKEDVANDIFAELQIDGDNTNLKDILTLCTELQIVQKDSLPRKICSNCSDHLRCAYIFNKTSLQAQNALSNFLAKEKSATTKSNAIKTTAINQKGAKSILKTKQNDNNTQTEKNIYIKTDPIDSNNIKLKKENSYDPNLKQVRILPKVVIDFNNLQPSNNQQFELLDMFKSVNVVIANNNQNNNNEILNNFTSDNLNGRQMVAYPCTKCSKKFISDSHLQKHLEQYHLELKLSSDCSICNVRFDSPEELTNHNLEIHFPSANRSVCEICNKEYRNKYLMVRHKKKMHPPSNSSLCCEGCGRLYSSAASLQAHQRQCCRRGCSPCRYCARGFASRGALHSHQALRHAPPLDRPYSCAFCPKKFSAKKVLLRHQRSRHRTSREVLLCGHCDSKDFGFLSAERLTEHLKKEHQNLAEESEPTAENELPYVITYYAVKEENEQESEAKYDPSTVWVEKVVCLDGGWEGVKLEGAVSGNRENTGNADMGRKQSDVSDDISWAEDGSDANLREIEEKITDGRRSNDIIEVVERSDANIKEIGGSFKEQHQSIAAGFRGTGGSFRNDDQGDRVGEMGGSFREQDFREIGESSRDEPSDSREAVTEGSVKALKGAEGGAEGVIAITVDGATGRVCCTDSAGQEVNRVHTPDRELLPNINSFLKTSLATPAKARGKRKKDSEEDDMPDRDKDADAAFTCQICDKRCFYGTNGPVTELPGKFFVEIDYLSFLRLINLEKHVGQHMGASSLTCVICSYRASDGTDMASHLKACRASQTAQRLACPICGKKLTTAAGLRYHVQTHSALRRHACPTCGRRFLALSGLRVHCRAVHSAARPHRCVACSRRFATADHLRKHARSTHHKSREHACRMCGKTFLQSSHVRQHMWIHTGIKPHSCPHCPNQYTASCSLAKHLRRNHWEQQHQKHVAEEEMYRKLLEEEGNPVPESFQMPFIRHPTYADPPRNKSRQQNKPYPTSNSGSDRSNTITIDGQMVTIEHGDMVTIENSDMVAIEDGDMVTIEGEDMENECDLEDEDGLDQFDGDKVVIEDLDDGVKVVIVSEEGIEDDLGEW